MQGARGWCRWCCRPPGNEPHDSPLPNEKIRHLPEAVRLSCTPPLLAAALGQELRQFRPFQLLRPRHFRLKAVFSLKFSNLRRGGFGASFALTGDVSKSKC